ncbi:MAG: ABC transporter ATP-binding protein, partial [Gammaproteobacteria bacterium]|nr:ABC transporter ATP-binding protein [Gammaproteobacteria bacterium]
MDSSFIIAEKAPNLPTTPWRFALYFYQKIRLALAAIFVFEAAQASCTIMLPYAVKQIIDAVTLANETGADIFEASHDAMVFFALLNLGIVIFSRASGAVLVSNGPVLRAKIRKSLFRYLQFHSHRYFVSHFAGSLANRISEVSISCMHALWTIAFTFYPLIIQSVVALVILFLTSPQLAVVLTLWLFAYTSVSVYLARRCQVYSKDFAAA